MDLLKWFRRKPPEAPVFVVSAPEPEPEPVAKAPAPPRPVLTKGQFITCPKCKKQVASWRTYANGKQECASCASLR